MLLLDKYIYAIGQKLPLKNRKEIQLELESLLLDEIEATYGENPTEEDIKKAITSFGSPWKVAKEYGNNQDVISPGFTDLFFIISKIIVGALSVAFVTIFIVGLFTKNPSGLELFKEFIKVPFNIIQASISGIGFLTIIFIILSRVFRNKVIDIDEDWTIKELETINLSPEQESKIEAVIAIVLIPIFTALIVLYPEIIQNLENLFEKSTLTLGNKINLEVFKTFIPVFVVQGILEVSYHVALLKKEIKTRSFYIFELAIAIIGLIVTVVILQNKDMFIYKNGIDAGLFTHSTIGFKVFVLVGLISGIGELISKIIKLIKLNS
ncbi:MAG: hypothetical protein JXR64_04105 [Spirochaetales bacterium]|nr:hypothetical protein [Spirochaetales bacterium]